MAPSLLHVLLSFPFPSLVYHVSLPHCQRYSPTESIFARDGEKLFDLVQREQVALTVFGHDKQQRPTLKKAPAYYD